MNNESLQIVRNMDGIILDNDNVVFENTLLIDGDISYDLNSGIITVNKPGRYLFWWFIVVQALLGSTNKFAISVDNYEIMGNSPNKRDGISGYGVINISNVPTEISLVNRSESDVFLATDVDVCANLVLNRIPDIIENPYLNISFSNMQTLNEGDILIFDTIHEQKIINYETPLNLILIPNPGIYQISLYFFSDATTIRMNSHSYPGNRDFDFPSGYGYKTITFLESFPASNYISFLNPTTNSFNFGFSSTNENGGLVITKVSDI